jgi:S-adenosylmethionine:tRNA ribosyltransferase-isomerase
MMRRMRRANLRNALWRRLLPQGEKGKTMRVELFDFELPPERIALEPARPREAAGMLVVGPDGALGDRRIGDLPEFLRPGDALVVNDTRVIAARLEGSRMRGGTRARIEATLIQRVDSGRWRAFVRPAKKLNIGERVRFGDSREGAACLLGTLDAVVEAKNEGEILLAFDFAGAALDDAIEAIGQMPLPPYIAARRAPGASDRADYQTLFAAEPGAVAAPTAGLHFTHALVARVEASGARILRTTLHVGAGTFLPVKADDTDDHRMHVERGSISADVAAALNETRERGGRIIAVGTTSLRILESAADPAGRIHPFAGETSMFC